MKSTVPEEDPVMIFFSKWSRILEFPEMLLLPNLKVDRDVTKLVDSCGKAVY